LEETTKIYQAILENQLPRQDSAVQEMTTQIPERLAAAVRDEPRGPAYPLVGRNEEWDTLLREYAAAKPDGRVCFIVGEVGVGKTRLAVEFLDHARQQGAKIFEAHCYHP
jgi:transcriptional regulator with AAA-type ATPase domain